MFLTDKIDEVINSIEHFEQIGEAKQQFIEALEKKYEELYQKYKERDVN